MIEIDAAMDDEDFDSETVSVLAGKVDRKVPEQSLLDVIPEYEKVEGWLKLADAQALFEFAAAVDGNACVVEVGSSRGRSTVALCAGVSVGGDVPVFAIDPHEKFTGTKAVGATSSNRRGFFRTMLNTKMDKHVRLLNTRSDMVAGAWKKPVGLLFVNGERRYETARRDFLAWVPHLRHGAAVIFRDGQQGGPSMVIKEFTEKGLLEPGDEIGSLSVFRYLGSDEGGEEGVRHEALLSVDPAFVVDPRLKELPGLDLHTVAYNVYYGGDGKYLYQAIPKCACTSVKTILLELEGLPVDPDEWPRHDKSKNQFPGAQDLNPEDLEDLFQGRTDTFKFVVVRDPYTRVASAYRDKIRMMHKPRAPHWIRSIQKAAVKQDIKISEEITFEEFVRVISGQPFEDMDPHWRPQYFEGRFGLIKYDYIAHMEMLDSDLPYILERIDAPDDLHRKAAEPHNVTGSHFALWGEVSNEVRREFRRHFAIDFDTLHYPYRTFLKW